MSTPAQIMAAAAEKMRAALSTHHTEGHEGEGPMSRLTEDLKAAGWTETTLADCEVGDEVVVLTSPGTQGIITAIDERYARIDGLGWEKERPALRAPRPEPEPTFERGEVWRCRNNQDGAEGNLIRRNEEPFWMGKFQTGGPNFWWKNEVTPLRKLLNADGTVPAQDLPEWDPEREWPLGTVVEATLDGGRIDGGRIEYVMADSSEPLSWSDGLGDWERSTDLHNVRILSVPGHPAPTGPYLRERLLDEGMAEAVARKTGEIMGQKWDELGKSRKEVILEDIDLYLAAAADVLDPVGERA